MILLMSRLNWLPLPADDWSEFVRVAAASDAEFALPYLWSVKLSWRGAG